MKGKMKELESLVDAFDEKGWDVHLFPEDVGAAFFMDDDDTRVGIFAGGNGWEAEIKSGWGKDDNPVQALRRAYAAEDSRHIRELLLPVLVAFREPVEQREAAVSELITGELKGAPTEWLMTLGSVILSMSLLVPDPVDLAILAFGVVEPPTEEIRRTVAEMRARLEEMG